MGIIKDYSTAKEIAELLDYTTSHVRNLAKAGVIPAKKFRTKWLFKKDEVLEALELTIEGKKDDKMDQTASDLG